MRHGTFTAMFNTPPRVLVDSFPTIRLTRPVTAAGATSAVAIDVDPSTDGATSAKTIKISDYFDFASLQRNVMKSTPDEAIEDSDLGATAENVAALASKMDLVGDTVCDVTVSTTLGVVQRLNEAGEVLADAASPYVVVGKHLAKGTQALAAIRIDSRVSALGSDGTVSAFAAPAAASIPTDDTLAKEEGAFDIAIRCADKDATAKVTGRVVVKKGT